MRFKLTLVPLNKEILISFDYQYFLSTAIYKILQKADAEYSEMLKNDGYALGNKKMKLFTFSNLQFLPNTWAVKKGFIQLIEKPQVTLIVSSYKNDFSLNFVKGLFLKQRFFIKNPYNTFEIQNLELLPKINFEDGKVYRFVPLSPIFLSRKEGENIVHLTNETPEFGEFLKRNIEEKYRTIFGKEPIKSEFDFSWEKITDKRPTKLVTIKGIQLRTMFHPFYLKASSELLEIGYECGFGGKNSEGFGMVEIKQ